MRKLKKSTKASTAEKAFEIEDRELVNKRLAVAMAVDPGLAGPKETRTSKR